MMHASRHSVLTSSCTRLVIRSLASFGHREAAHRGGTDPITGAIIIAILRGGTPRLWSLPNLDERGKGRRGKKSRSRPPGGDHDSPSVSASHSTSRQPRPSGTLLRCIFTPRISICSGVTYYLRTLCCSMMDIYIRDFCAT